MDNQDIKILVVDDEEYLLELWEELFSILGYSILKATSGNEGIEIIKSNMIDILVTDLKMPDSDGLELLNYVRDFYTGNIKTYLCSGFLDEAKHDLSVYKLERIISKPFKVTDELANFRKVLDLY